MNRHLNQRSLRIVALVLIISTTAGFQGFCSSRQQPKTVADILTTLGNLKRDLRAREEISPQADYDISEKLLAANRAYRSFVIDELARLDSNANASPSPDARRNAVNALITALRGLQDPSILGIRSESARKLWREGVAGMNTVIAGLEALRREQ